MTKVDQLPSELVLLILSHVSNKDLPSCALINKSFYREAMPLLWHTIDLHCPKNYIAFITCLKQSPHSHHVRSLSFCNVLVSARAVSLLEHVHDVSNWDSLGTGNIIANLQYIPRYCPRLTSLEMWYGYNYDPVAHRIAQATIVSTGHYCKQLTKLDLYDCSYSIVDDLFGVLKDAPLTDIRLSMSTQADLQPIQRFLKTAPLALHRYQQLTTLAILLYDNATNFLRTINTHGLTWPHLKTFSLRGCYYVTDAMALSFVQAHPTIECLCLRFSKLTDVFLDGLVDHLPNLTMLGVEDTLTITAAGICRLITNYGGLKYGVYCEGCDIYPKDLPNDKTYGYELDCEVEDNPPVEWFDGTFCDNDDSEQAIQDHEDQP